MKRVAALLLAVCVVSLARAETVPPGGRADPGPRPGDRLPPPKEGATVRVTTVVDALEDFSDYAFFEVYESDPVPPRNQPVRSVTMHYIPAASGAYSQPVPIGSSTFYGVPKAEAERIPGWRAF